MDSLPGCCAPSRDSGGTVAAAAPGGGEPTDGMVAIGGREFAIGSEDPYAYHADGEGPVRRVTVDAFRIDACAVSNDRFAAFAAATGYRTEAERFGWSFVFAGLLPDDYPPTRGVATAPWWRQVEGADWAHPLEPGGEHRMNVWQGRFPNDNTGADGFYGTSPVDAFPPNGHGLHNAT